MPDSELSDFRIQAEHSLAMDSCLARLQNTRDIFTRRPLPSLHQ
jgi:hypothetical protein